MASNFARITLAALAICLAAEPALGQYANPPAATRGYPYPPGTPVYGNPYAPAAAPQPTGYPANPFPMRSAYPLPPLPATGAATPYPSWPGTPAVNTSHGPGSTPAEAPHIEIPAYGDMPTYDAPPQPVPEESFSNHVPSAEPSAAAALLGPDCTDCLYGGAGHGFFFNYDYMRWTISAPDATLIGHPALEGLYTRGGVTTLVQNSLDTSFLDVDYSSGHRLEFGHMDCDVGWVAGYTFGTQEQAFQSSSVTFLPEDAGAAFPTLSYFTGYADGNGDGIDDDIDMDNFFGRFGEDIGTPNGMGGFAPPFDGTPDTPAPTDTGDLQIYLPVFTQVNIRNVVRLQDLELMQIHRTWNEPAGSFEWLYGFRYLNLEEVFGFEGVGGVLDATSFAATADNQLIGLQIGARWRRRYRGWTFNAEGRFLAAANLQDAQLQGVLASNGAINNTGQNSPIRLDPQAFNHTRNNQEWSPLGELRLQAIYAISPWAAIRVGYTGFVAGGISRASQKVQYAMPRFGLSGAGSNETVVFNSFTVGFEIKR